MYNSPLMVLVALSLLAAMWVPLPRSSDTLTSSDQENLESKRVMLANVPFGGYCSDGHKVLSDELQLGAVTFVVNGDAVEVRGAADVNKAKRRESAYRPRELVAPESGQQTISAKQLEKGVDVEVAGMSGKGIGVVRVERDWRGIVWGPLTAWRFDLDDDELAVVDADVNGRITTSDRMLYGQRIIWMPWHTLTISGDEVYRDITISDAAQGVLSATVEEMDDVPRKDADRFAEWNEVRKNHGIPPGIYDAEWSKAAIKHADYLEKHDVVQHHEDEGKEGYSKEGHDAGMSSCVMDMSQREDPPLRFCLDSAYHRCQLINPRSCYIHLGGNDHAYLLGPTWGTEHPTEERETPEFQRYPAPGSTVPRGTFAKGTEYPTPTVMRESENPGLPIICRDHKSLSNYSDVSCHLYAVDGDLRTGERDDEIKCHLAYPGHNTPSAADAFWRKVYREHWGMVMLTPLKNLKKGWYEADFKFKADGKEYHYNWRFYVEREE